jgi:prepilin-type processing-associated H-X9-DG protein
MLVIDGALHPRFIPGSDFLNIRNGAGVTEDGTLWLAISNEPVNFHDFARLFRDALGTPNALYFDGSVSRLYRRDTGRHDLGFPLGPIIGTAVPAD